MNEEEKRQACIMVVDDAPQNLTLLTNMLQKRGYRVYAFPSGELAVKAVKKSPPDLILLDINMPEMNGYVVCEKIKSDKSIPDFPIIFLSALTEIDDKVKAFRVGGVDYISKPFQFEEVDARVQTHLKIRDLQAKLEESNKNLQEKVEEQVKEISESQMSTIFSLAKLAEYRDIETGKHLERVQDYCHLIAKTLRESEYRDQVNDEFIETIYHASPLHDIGKVAIPDKILLKPGELTESEFEIMKTHAAIGAKALVEVYKKYSRNYFIRMGIEIARSHHERWDGKGYPDHLTGDQTPLAARIMKLVDVYDALRAKRCYKDAYDHTTTYKIIVDGRGTEFDPVLIDVFVKLEKQFNSMHKL
ncbi:MAG: response regulator [Gammaproteobacteria bacterium]|nr:response regulator [Gammaproteobacteria bacterium]